MDRRRKKNKNKAKPPATNNATVGNGEAPAAAAANNTTVGIGEALLTANNVTLDTGEAPAAATNNATLATERAPVREENHEPASEQNYRKQSPGNNDSQTPGDSETDVRLKRDDVNEERQTDLEEKLKTTLQTGIDSCIQKEARLEKHIDHLQNEKDSFLTKEESWNARLGPLQSEINSWILKEAGLKEKIRALEDDKESCILKENSTKEMIAKLDDANIALQKQVKELEASRDSIVQENQQLLKSITLLEFRVQQLEEASSVGSSAIETTEVKELEASRDSIVQENQQLLKSTTLLEFRIQQLEEASSVGSSAIETTQHLPEDKIAMNQIQPDHDLGEVLAENTEVVKTVNEPRNEFDHHNIRLEHNLRSEFSTTRPAKILSEYNGTISEFGDKVSFVENMLEVPGNGVNHGAQREELALAEAEESRSLEDLQQPLDEIQIQEMELQDTDMNKRQGVPLSDAPLIGAPFRVISFFAKYVSGADLVKENRPNSCR